MAVCAQLAPQMRYPTVSWHDVITPKPEIDAAAVLDRLRQSGAVDIREEGQDESA